MRLDDFNDPSLHGRIDAPAFKEACRSDHVKVLEAFLPYVSSEAALTSAVCRIASAGNVDMLDALLSANPQTPLNQLKDDGNPLIVASAKRRGAMVTALVKAGADAKMVHAGCRGWIDADGKGFSALHAWAARTKYVDLGSPQPDSHRYEPSQGAADDTEQSLEALKTLIAAGASVHQLTSDDDTPLHYAYDAATARMLVEAGADVNAANRRGETLLHIATDPEMLRYLLQEANAPANMQIQPQTSTQINPPLLETFASTHYDTRKVEERVTLFLDCGADPNIVDRDGNTALHLLAGVSRSDSHRTALVKRLLGAGLDVNARNYLDETPLHLLGCSDGSFQAGDGETILATLLEAGGDLEARDSRRRTPLFFQLDQPKNRYCMMKICKNKNLFSAGARLDARDDSGRTLLHTVAGYDDEASQWLISRGCDATIADNDGNTLFHSLAGPSTGYVCGPSSNHSFDYLDKLVALGVNPQQANKSGQTPLHIASCVAPGAVKPTMEFSNSAQGSTSVFDWFLVRTRQGDKVDAAGQDGITALHLASTFSEYMASRLIESGADPLKETSEGLNCLHLAARACQTNILALMLDTIVTKHGKDACTGILNRTTTHHPRSPLFYAAASGRPESVRMLLDAGMAAGDGKAYQDSALQGVANFATHPKASANYYDTYDGSVAVYGYEDEPSIAPLLRSRPKCPRHVGSVTLQDTFRTEWQKQSHKTARIEEIMELLRMHPGFEEQQLQEAAEEVKANNNAYVLDGLMTLQRKLGMAETSTDDILTTRKEQRLRLNDKMTAEQCLTPEEFKSAVDARLFDVAAAGALPEGRFDDDPFVYRRQTTLQYLIEGCYASLLKDLGNTEAIRQLEDAGWAAEIHKKSPQEFPGIDMRTPLIVACQRPIGNMDVVKLLVEQFGVDVNAGEPLLELGRRNAHPSDQQPTASPLHALVAGSCWWQIKEAIPYLVSKGADVNKRDSRSRTPLYAVLFCLKGNRLRFVRGAVEVLLQHGADVLAADEVGVPCLELAVHDADILRMLLPHAKQISSRLLIAAIDSLNADAVDVLLEAGADPNARELPEEEESFERYERGCAVLKLSKQHRFPLHHVLADGNSKMAKAPRMVASLLKHGADPLARYQKSTLMHQVLSEHDEHALQVLIEASTDFSGLGVDPNVADARGVTLFQLACSGRLEKEHDWDTDGFYRTRGSPTPVQVLLSLGGADIRIQDKEGNSALHLLARSWLGDSDLDMLREVARLAPELINQRNYAGDTPFLSLIKSRWGTNEETFGVLLEIGADATLADTAVGNTPAHLVLSDVNVGIQIHEAAVPSDGPAKRATLDRLLAVPGVDINCRNHAGETPVFGCMRKSCRILSVEQLERRKPIDWGTIAARVDGARCGSEAHLNFGVLSMAKAMDLLSERGVDWTVKNNDGETPLDVARKNGAEDQVKYLESKGLGLGLGLEQEGANVAVVSQAAPVSQGPVQKRQKTLRERQEVQQQELQDRAKSFTIKQLLDCYAEGTRKGRNALPDEGSDDDL